MIHILAVIFAIAADQVSKQIVAANMEIGDSFGLVKYILNVTYVTNRGAAFGIFKDHRWVFLVFSTIAIIVMCAILAFLIRKKQYISLRIALVFMISGGMGNMIDRVLLGHVIDFLEFDFMNFAIFNFADILISMGCVLFCISIFMHRNTVFGEPESKNESGTDIK